MSIHDLKFTPTAVHIHTVAAITDPEIVLGTVTGKLKKFKNNIFHK